MTYSLRKVPGRADQASSRDLINSQNREEEGRLVPRKEAPGQEKQGTEGQTQQH